jgi:hypothetical protein
MRHAAGQQLDGEPALLHGLAGQQPVRRQLPALSAPGSADARRDILHLQRTLGNAAVTRLLRQRHTAQTVQRCGDHVDEDCATCSPATVSRQVEQPVVQRQPAPDPWSGAPASEGGSVSAPLGGAAGSLSYRVVEDDVKVPASGEIAGLLGLPPESIPPGALSNPDFLLSVAANTPGASAASLQEMTGLPDSVMGALPEGKVVEVDDSELTGLPKEKQEESHAPVQIHGGIRGADQAIAHNLAHTGFNSAGPNAIGIVAFPQSRLVRFATSPSMKSLLTPGPLLPESKIVLGHTAVYVRIDNKIHVIKSYAPVSLTEAAINFGKVRSGTGGVPAQIIDHLGHPHPPGGVMFDIPSGQSIEYAVPKDVAFRFADSLPEGGPLPSQLYTAQPEVSAALGKCRLCNGRNCVHWAVAEVEKALGAPVGPKGQSVIDVGGADKARQGKMQDFLTPDPKSVEAPVRVAGEPVTPVRGRMPTHIKVFKYGGKAFGVFSYGLSIYRIANAPEGHEAQVVLDEIGGHAGGSWGAEAGVGLCLALAPETAGLSLLACGIFGGVVGSGVGGKVFGGIGEALDSIINAPVLVGAALAEVREILGDLGSGASALAHAPVDMLFQNLIERREELNVANWDIRYLPTSLSDDLRSAGEAVWSRIGPLDAQGLIDIADKSIESLGVRGDVAGRLARGVSDIARKNGQDYLVITPEALLKLTPFEFADTIKSWNLTFVQEPGYISGSGGRFDNEAALRFGLYPLLRTRATINPANWDVDSIRVARRDDGTAYNVPQDVKRVGTIVWNNLSGLDEHGFTERVTRPLPGQGIPDDLLDLISDGLTEVMPVATTPEVLRQLTPEKFVGYLIDWKSGFKHKNDPEHVAETSLRWVRAGFKPW